MPVDTASLSVFMDVSQRLNAGLREEREDLVRLLKRAALELPNGPLRNDIVLCMSRWLKHWDHYHDTSGIICPGCETDTHEHSTTVEGMVDCIREHIERVVSESGSGGER